MAARYLCLAVSASLALANDDVSLLQTSGSVKRTREELRGCVYQYADGMDALGEKFKDTMPEWWDKKTSRLGSVMRDHPLTVPTVSERKMIFGVGSGSTGTMSLKAALTTLGVPTGHAGDKSGMKGWEDVDHFSQVATLMLTGFRPMLRTYDWTSQIPKEMEAIVDTPMNELFADLFLAYPQAKFILTTRPSKDLAKVRMHGPWTYMPMQEPFLTNSMNLTEEMFVEMHELNDQLIRCTVPKEKIMEIDLFTKPTENLMNDLADFVEAPRPSGLHPSGVPKSEFPHCYTRSHKGNNPFCADVEYWSN